VSARSAMTDECLMGECTVSQTDECQRTASDAFSPLVVCS
jgi:hypothetical protein